MFSTKLFSSPAVLVVVIVHAAIVVVTHAQIGSVTPSCDEGEAALGMGNYFIEDSQLSAYHAYNVGPVENGRYIWGETSQYWAGKTNDDYKWYEVDLLAHTVITGLTIQGRVDEGQTEKRILTYSIEYSSDGSTFVDYEESGSTTVFEGNTVQGSTVNETFSKAIIARKIRIIPVTYEGKPTMRLELYGCYQARTCLQWAYLDADYQALEGLFWSSGSRALQYYDSKYNHVSVCYYDEVNGEFWDCTSPLGVGNGYIDDSQMTASSSLGNNHPWKARYDMSGVWMPSDNDDDEWLEIDFTTDTFISGFNTRGDSSSSSQLDTFLVTYSTDGSNYSPQTEFGEPQDIDRLYLYQTPMTARYLKFTAVSWTNDIALAVEVYGCGHHVPTAFPTVDSVVTTSFPSYGDCDGREGYFYIDEDGDGNSDYTYCTRITEQLYDTCYEALGMEDYTITKSQITTSGDSAARFNGDKGRLNVESGGNGWKPETKDANQWLMVDLGTDSIPLVTGVGTQSRGNNYEQYVTSLKISHSVDGSTFTTIQGDSGDKIFNGNTGYGTVKYNYFETALHVRFVRFEPQTYNEDLSMRVEVYGCRNGIVASENLLDEGNSTYGWYYTSGSSWDFKTTVDGSYVNPADLASLSGLSISASSEKNGNEATEGVLDNTACWVPSTTSANEWLQFDFAVGTVVTRIEIQGHHSSVNKYVESYYILHAMSDDSFTTFQHGGSDYLFAGNDGSGVDVIASETFNPPIVARYIRISPQSWGTVIGLRAALYGVQHSATCSEWEADQYNASPGSGYYLYTGITNPVYCPIDNSPDYGSCKDYKDAGFTDDHYYILNPSGGSFSDTIFVYCDFTSVANNAVAMVTVSSDMSGWTYLESYNGNYSSSVTYSSKTAANVGNMASASDYCYQYLMYNCVESMMYSGSVAVSWWEDKDANQMPYWAGNDAESTGCYCNEAGNCARASDICHCDLTNRYSEGGWITNNMNLPIGGLTFSDISDGSSSGNFTVGDLVCFTKSGGLPSSCYDVAQDGHSTNGLYLLKLSTGDYIPVYCDFNSVENAIITQIGHDFESAYDISGYDRAGRFARDINYDYSATISKTGLLVDGEDACRQRIEFSCENGAIVDPGGYSWLGIRNGSKALAWAGTSADNMCPCGVLGSCFDNSQSCNCDGVQTTIHEDNGWVTDRSKLPLKQIRVGGVPDGTTATVKVGKLECFKEDSGSSPPESCYEIKQNGDSIAGDYLIDPDGSGGEEPFVVHCDPSFNSTHAQMIIHHDSEDRTHVVDKASAGEYQKMVTYDGVTIEQFNALFSNDINEVYIACVQTIQYECYASTLLKNDMSWFVDRLGAPRTNFGVANESLSSCQCGVDGSCSSASELCNCDFDAISWAEDSGDINDFYATFLPVTQLRFGDTAGGVGNEEGYHTLGPLICSAGPRPPICIRDNPCVRGSCSGDDFGTDDFVCDCTGTGYEGSNCTTDYDECANDDHSCDPVSEECGNTVGSYDCTCTDGFVDNSGTCEDIDECTDGVDDCLSSLSTCQNTPGNYTCDCDTGYEGDGLNSGNGCSNIDECSDGTDTCHYRASCTDSVGSYTCDCNAGYTGDGESCTDEDECTLGLDNCLSGLSRCLNGIGTFSCECVNGYEGDGVSDCSDIDECGDSSDSCHAQSQCNNTIGSYTCTCNSGFSGSGWVCNDIDECTVGTHNCLNNTGNCTNTYGSFGCACNSGYHGDGITVCNDTDECTEEIDNCHPSLANCTNTIGDFICTCFAGYSGNGVGCVEINECIDYNVTCSGVGICVDLIDDYICDCEYGYWDKNCDKDAAYLYTSNFFPGSLYWSFDTFNETGDSSYPNQNVNMSVFNAFPGLAVQQNYSISGNSIQTRFNGTDDCIDFGDFSGSCFSDPSLCTDGLALSFWMRLTEDEIKESGPVYIMSSGMPDARGFGIYRETRKITVQVNDGSTTFTVELNNLMPADLWKNVGFAWSSTVGLSVFLDRARVGNDPSGSSTGLSDVLNTITVGCRYNGGSYTAHSTGMFDELIIFPMWINTTNELIWLMGGWDEDNCVIEPCVQGDCYDAGMAAYMCDCFPGYNETNCDMEIDECESYPCQNGGTCTDWIAYYTCECAFGYTGYSCEKDLSPNYDYSNVKSLKAQFLLITPEINPYYATVADHYFPLNNLGELEITGVNISAAFGRAELGLYPSINGADTYVEIGNFTDGCLSDPSFCPYGFTLAFWFRMNERATDMNDGVVFSTAGPVNGERVGINIVLSRRKELWIEVCDGSTVSKVVISKTELTFIHWLHLGVSWSADQGLIVYFGGKTHTTETTVENSNAVNTYDTMTLGSLFGSLGSAASVVFNDLVIWGRAIRPYERHILFGMTRREFAMIETSDHYWTSDGYVRRDWTTLADYMPEYAANIHPMDRAGEADVILGHGRDEKGQSIMVLGDGDGWLFFGDFAGTCISNIHKCSDGISVSTWVRLSQVYDNETHFFLSSGEQVTRGFSIFQREVDRLGAAVTDGYTRWVTEIVHVPFIQYEDNMTVTDAPGFDFMGEWTNLGLTWTQDEGLFFYMNGRVVAHDPIGYQKFRTSDFETILILGRRNDYLGHASNISFDELVIAERKMEPYQYRDTFAKMDNLQYADAQYKWGTLDLISGNPHVLSAHSLPPGFMFNETAYPRVGYVGPTPNITLEDDLTVNLPGYPDYITLGDFRETFVSKPAGKGLSVSLWAKFHFDVETSGNDAANVVVNPPSENDTTTMPPPTTPAPPVEKQYLLSSGGQGSTKGFNIFLEGRSLNFVVDDGSMMSWKRINTAEIKSDTWTNIAFTWHRREKFIIYINGKEIAPIDVIVNVTSCCQGNQTLFTVGRGMRENSEYATFKLHNLVIWEKYIHPQHVYKLLGVTNIEKYYMELSDYYWPFDPPADFSFPLLAFEGGARLKDDRHHFGRSAYTDGKKDYVRLHDFGSAHCVTNPARCVNGMAMGMWVKLRDIPSGAKCLLTSGADVADERGVAVVQTPDYLEFVVSDGRNTWTVKKFLDKDLFSVWLYLAFRWRPESGLRLFINGRNEGEKVSGVEDGRSSVKQTELLLGRCSYTASSNGYLEAYFDDIIVMTPTADQSQPGASELHGDPICTGYVTPDLYFNLTSPDSGVSLYDTKTVKRITKYGGDKRGVSLFHKTTSRGLVDIGNFRHGCLSSPSGCNRGVTISFWMRLLNIDNLDDPALNPQRKAYILSSGAHDINSTGFAIFTNNVTTTVEVRTEHGVWKKHYLIGFVDEWTNLALTWGKRDGLSFFVNGEIQYDYEIPTTVSTYNSTYDATTSVPPTTTPIPTTTEAPTTVVTTQAMTTEGDVTNGTTPGNVSYEYTTDYTTTPLVERETTLEVTTTPMWTTPYRWSPRENDTYSHLVLGARNDLNEGYTRAEFADLAVWYDVIDMMNPELAKMVTGEECHEIVITDNHEELAGYEVWTGTIECDDRHLADCTDDLDTFFEVISKASFEDPTVYEIAKDRLKNYTQTGIYMTVDEMKMTTVLLEKALTRTLPAMMMPEEAMSDMEDLLSVTSNLFNDNRRRRWTTIHQARRRRGTSTTDSAMGLAVKLENYLMAMAKIVEGVNGTWTDINMTIVTDNIVVQVDRYRADDVIPGTIYQFPDYDNPLIQAPNSSWYGATDQITLPRNVYDYIPANRDNNGVIIMIGIMFHTLDEILPIVSNEDAIYKESMHVDSRIMYLRIEPPLRKSLYNKIVMQFEHKTPLSSKDEPFCVFWDFDVRYTKEGAWSMRGCALEETNDTHTTCHCDHLTHFAILIQDRDLVVESIHAKYLSYITWGGIVLSLIALIFLLLIFISVADLYTIRNSIHINMILSMLFAKITYIVIDFLDPTTIDWISCKAIACVMQFFYTGVFSWMLVQGAHLLVEVCNPKNVPYKQKFRYYFLVAWGIPFMIVGTSFAMAHQGYGTTDECWLTFENNALWIFLGTSLTIIFINMMIIMFVYCNTSKQAKRSDPLKSRKASLRATAIMLPLLGITWSLSVVEVKYGLIELTYVSTALHALQGLFIAIFYGVGNPEVRLAFMGADLELEFSKVQEVSATPEPEEIEMESAPKPSYKA